LKTTKSPSVSQEICRVLWNSKDYNHLYNRPTFVLILGQVNPVHAPKTISVRSFLILFSHLLFGLLIFYILLRFFQTMYLFLPPLYVLYAPPISFFSTQHTKTTEESISTGDIL